jgi:hypothetical protein
LWRALRRRGLGHLGLPDVELRAANDEAIAGLQQMAPGNLLSIHERTVRAAQVRQYPAFRDLLDPGVPSRHTVLGQDQIIVVATPDAQRWSLERNALTGQVSLLSEQTDAHLHTYHPSTLASSRALAL